jgi:hypothetical protein
MAKRNSRRSIKSGRSKRQYRRSSKKRTGKRSKRKYRGGANLAGKSLPQLRKALAAEIKKATGKSFTEAARIQKEIDGRSGPGAKRTQPAGQAGKMAAKKKQLADLQTRAAAKAAAEFSPELELEGEFNLGDWGLETALAPARAQPTAPAKAQPRAQAKAQAKALVAFPSIPLPPPADSTKGKGQGQGQGKGEEVDDWWEGEGVKWEEGRDDPAAPGYEEAHAAAIAERDERDKQDQALWGPGKKEVKYSRMRKAGYERRVPGTVFHRPPSFEEGDVFDPESAAKAVKVQQTTLQKKQQAVKDHIRTHGGTDNILEVFINLYNPDLKHAKTFLTQKGSEESQGENRQNVFKDISDLQDEVYDEIVQRWAVPGHEDTTFETNIQLRFPETFQPYSRSQLPGALDQLFDEAYGPMASAAFHSPEDQAFIDEAARSEGTRERL